MLFLNSSLLSYRQPPTLTRNNDTNSKPFTVNKFQCARPHQLPIRLPVLIVLLVRLLDGRSARLVVRLRAGPLNRVRSQEVL